ncbi:MAG: ribosome silencing factor [Bacteroidetes bacterium]|nr:ribosome silencing factor [Bacteroidota bacterium]
MAKKKANPVRKTVTKIKKSGAVKSPKKKAVVKKISSAKKSSISKSSVKKTAVKKVAPKKKTPVKLVKPAAKKVVKKIVNKNPKTAETLKASAKPRETIKNIVKDSAQLLSDAAVEGILEVKGRNITIMNLKKIHNRVCDYYIICQADSNTQVNAIAGSVEEMIKKKTGEKPYRSEGFQNSEWILVDYITVVVHIFQTQIRNFYNLESLWADAEITELAFD